MRFNSPPFCTPMESPGKLHHHFHRDGLVERHFIEIDVQESPPVRVYLDFANQYLPGRASIDFKIQELALAAGASEQFSRARAKPKVRSLQSSVHKVSPEHSCSDAPCRTFSAPVPFNCCKFQIHLVSLLIQAKWWTR